MRLWSLPGEESPAALTSAAPQFRREVRFEDTAKEKGASSLGSVNWAVDREAPDMSAVARASFARAPYAPGVVVTPQTVTQPAHGAMTTFSQTATMRPLPADLIAIWFKD